MSTPGDCLSCMYGDHHACEDPHSDIACGCYRHNPDWHRQQAVEHERAVAEAKAARKLRDERRRWERRAAQMASAEQASLGLVDAGEAADRSVHVLESHDDVGWLDHAEAAFGQVARRQPYLTVDDVWKQTRANGAPEPHDTRLMGAAVRRALRARWIRTERADTNPRLYRSQVHRRNT